MQDVPATIVIASRPDNRTTRFFPNKTRTEQAMTRIIRKMIGILLAVAITATVGTAAENHGSKKRIHYG
jgi:hypothetical protein